MRRVKLIHRIDPSRGWEARAGRTRSNGALVTMELC
jgi:hypothetical protein